MTRHQLWLVYAALTPVLAASAYASFNHTVHVAQRYGQDVVSAHLLPLSIDGLMLVASIVLTSAKTRRAIFIARATLVLGFTASFAANMLATQGGVIAHIISGWFAASLLLGVELLQHTNTRSMKVRATKAELEAAAIEAEATAKAEEEARIAAALKAKRQESARKGVETKRAKKAAVATKRPSRKLTIVAASDDVPTAQVS